MASTTGTIFEASFIGSIVEEVQAGREVALCSVLSTQGSAPRHAGARMAAFVDGSFAGTVGGGRIEQTGQRRCRELLRRVREASGGNVRSSLEWVESRSLGMLCGGSALISVRVLGKDDLDVLHAIMDAGSIASEGWLIEDWSRADAPSWRIREGDIQHDKNSPSWDDETQVYQERICVDSLVHVFGGGHVAAALVPVLASVGFRVEVLDGRKELATAERFPHAERIICCDYDDLAAATEITFQDYVVVVTPNHAFDLMVLAYALRFNPRYIGCMGSKRKAERVRSILADKGFSQSQIDAIRIPIGDAIGAVTPAELAISIAAELIRERSSL